MSVWGEGKCDHGGNEESDGKENLERNLKFKIIIIIMTQPVFVSEKEI